MSAIPPTTDDDLRASRAERPEAGATISPLAAVGAVLVLMSLWFGTVTVLDRTANQPYGATTSGLEMPSH